MKGFEKLLDTVRKSSPDLISEEAAQEMLADYQSYENQLQDDAFSKGKAAGFEEGYREGIEKQKAVCQQELDELLAKCDEDATAKLEAIMKTLNDDHAEKLQEVYDTCCANMVPRAELDAMDEDHAVKLEQVVTQLDNDHAAKFQQAMEAVDRDHAKKMQIAVESVKTNAKSVLDNTVSKYKAIIKESNEKYNSAAAALKAEKSKKLSMLSESVEKYLNYALQSAIPTKRLVSEAKYSASQKALEKISSILKINNILQESKDGIFQDYESKLKDAQNEQNKLMVENVNLKNALQKKEAKLLLESKVAKCTPAEAAFLRSYFENAKSPKVIEEQIEDARAAYSRLHSEKRAEVVSKVRNASVAPSGIVNESKKPVVKRNESKTTVTESTEQKRVQKNTFGEANPFLSAYTEMLKNN